MQQSLFRAAVQAFHAQHGPSFNLDISRCQIRTNTKKITCVHLLLSWVLFTGPLTSTKQTTSHPLLMNISLTKKNLNNTIYLGSIEFNLTKSSSNCKFMPDPIHFQFLTWVSITPVLVKCFHNVSRIKIIFHPLWFIHSIFYS